VWETTQNGRASRKTAALAAQQGDAFAEWVPPAESPSSLTDRVAAEARSLADQMRALQERYEQEHRRLADSLEFLTIQSRDLERELLAFGRLAEKFERGFALDIAPSSATVYSTPQADVPERDTAGCLEVRCLGGFDVRYDGRRVDLGTSRNGRLVFKYLVARAPGKRASKELLAETFWPETPIERALASLQSAVHQVKRAMGQSVTQLFGSPAIVYVDEHYAINPELELRSDVDAFRGYLREARALEARGQTQAAYEAYWLAHETYGGEFLPEERYEDWVAGERASLEADQLAVLGRLVQLHLDRGAYLECLNFGRRLLQLDPSREDVHRDLMRCYSRLGQRSEALRQYRRCFEALQSELELLPEAETTALYERVASGEAI
jgi:DNA-binding SARP family transcriptional activator